MVDVADRVRLLLESSNKGTPHNDTDYILLLDNNNLLY